MLREEWAEWTCAPVPLTDTVSAHALRIAGPLMCMESGRRRNWRKNREGEEAEEQKGVKRLTVEYDAEGRVGRMDLRASPAHRYC